MRELKSIAPHGYIPENVRRRCDNLRLRASCKGNRVLKNFCLINCGDQRETAITISWFPLAMYRCYDDVRLSTIQ